MPFHDLNVPYTTNHATLSHTLAFHAELGYSVIALSISASATGKLPTVPPQVPVSSLNLPKTVSTVLTRLTVTIADAAQNHRLASLQPHYSLLALRPTTQKALQLCCGSLECDLISLDLSQRLPFILKFSTVASALQRGVRFEICYSPGTQGGGNGDARRNLISGAAALIRATRGRGIILSSEARDALSVRGPYDVINLAQVWGLGQERGKEALCEEAEKVVTLAGLKRTSFRGVVNVVQGGGERSGKEAVTAPKWPPPTQQKAGSDIVGHAAPKEIAAPNGIKRKASTTSLTGPATVVTQVAVEKPLSKREMKRRAKKARLEGKAGPDGTETSVQDTTGSSFSIKHEALEGAQGLQS